MITVFLQKSLRYGRIGIACTLLALTLGACTTLPQVPPLLSLDPGTSPGSALAFNHKADTLASAAADGNVYLWQLPDGRALGSWRAHTSAVYGLAFLLDGRLLTASYDETLALWNTEGALIARRATGAPVMAMALSEDQRTFWTGHTDGSIREWRVDTLAPLASEHRHRASTRAVAYDRTSGRVASSDYDGRVYIGGPGEPAHALPTPPTDARDLVFTKDGRYLIGSGWFKLFRWDLSNDRLTVLPTAHHGVIKSLALTEDGTTLASISRETDSAVRFLDARTGETLQYVSTHDLCGAQVRVAPGGRYLASTSDDASVRVFALVGGRASGP